MKTLFMLSFLSALLFAGLAVAADSTSDTRVYEWRTYTAAPGKLDALLARFRENTARLFERHGMKNIGYWVPVESTDNQLIYLLSYPNREARDASWRAFLADPDWRKAARESEANGRLLSKAPESVLLSATDFSPPIISPENTGTRLFELRTYTAAEGKLSNLDARFRDHTIKLFEKHGMSNIGYWHPLSGQPGAGATLTYLLAHSDREAANRSWAGFRNDPDWRTARQASEEQAGGSLTAQGGVKSVFMTPVDFSPLK